VLDWRLDYFCESITARAEYHRLLRLIEPLIGSINNLCIAMHVLNWRQLKSYCKSLTARGRNSSTVTANWILNWQFKQTLHRMCLIGDSIPIVHRLALLTMRCQLSNVRITFVILLRIVFCHYKKRIISMKCLFNINVNVIKQLNCSCVSPVVDMSMHLKKLLITECSINDVTS